MRRNDWGTCASSCGCAKNRKTGWKGCLGGIASAGWLEDIKYSHFRERSCSSSAENVPVFEVLAIETLPRDSASLEDCSHVGALQVLVTALCSKRPFRVDTFYELILYLLWGEVDVKGKKEELTERFV